MTSISAIGQRFGQRHAVLFGAQRRRDLEEGAVVADVGFVEGQMIDRGAAGERQALILGAADNLQRIAVVMSAA